MRRVKRTMKILAAAVLALMVSPTKAQPRVAFTRTFDNVRVRFLSTQITANPAARAEWGFSAVVEADDARLLRLSPRLVLGRRQDDLALVQVDLAPA